MKQGFILYKSFYEPVKDLTTEEKAELFDAIFQYQLSPDTPLIFKSNVVKMAFSFFLNQFKLDESKYEEIKQIRAKVGKKGGEAKELAKLANASKSKQNEQMLAKVSKATDKDKEKDKEKDKVFTSDEVNIGDKRPEIPKEPVKGSVGEVLKSKFNFDPPKGITTEWQDKGFRYAKSLSIELKNELTGRWLRIFKQASEGRKPGNLERAFSYCRDHPSWEEMENEARMNLFFKIYENGLQENYKNI